MFTVQLSGRSPRLYREVVLPGDAPLSALRDHVTCLNELGLRNDRSSRPDQPRGQDARDVFPASSIYMDGVFYDDTRRVDTAFTSLSDTVRAWAARRGLGDIPVRDMTVRPGCMRVRLGHPAVLLHQGRCEHLLTLSEVRLTGAGGGGGSRGEARAAHNVLYCVVCARLAARWVVSQAASIPHEPAHLCEPCFRGYCYEGARKAFHFKAYDYRADELIPRDVEYVARSIIYIIITQYVLQQYILLQGVSDTCLLLLLLCTGSNLVAQLHLATRDTSLHTRGQLR